LTQNIILIGSGNVATFFARKLAKSGLPISQVISTQLANAKILADKYNATYSNSIKDIGADHAVVILAIPDNQIHQLNKEMSFENKLIIYSAGSISLQETKNLSINRGCIWPIFSIKKNNLPTTDVPLIINASNEKTLFTIKKIANAISTLHTICDDTQKLTIHLAAVFANNFTNHLMAISKQLCNEKEIPFELLHHLILNNISNKTLANPIENQTGPALRNDTLTLDKHRALLNGIEKDIYNLISKSIALKHIK
jgi:predicted short-subunit dehydrogenase-like oxidoreductase (DUF2520 family)